ncbi:MAG TPA: hypothetical protein VFE21_09690 [Rubrobacteraceae bacterium]|nr:hypothetical protein [Rubrobacteraceae bacterium]
MNGEGDGARLLEDVRVVEMGSVLAEDRSAANYSGAQRVSAVRNPASTTMRSTVSC